MSTFALVDVPAPPVADAPVDPPPAAPLLASPEVVTDAVHRHLHELPVEAAAKRWLFAAVAGLIAIGYLIAILGYWKPIHTGTDQNGYLVGGKMFAQNLSTAQEPRLFRRPDQFDPHAYIASMWVTAADDPHAFYPKYPLGLPFVYALCLWTGAAVAPLFGPDAGVAMAYLVSPLAMTAAVLGVFFLVRQFAGSFAGVLAMLVFATSPTTCNLVINPNSHAATVFCVVWGMICLLHWWRRGGRFWAVTAGLLVGYAATIRYTEGLLILPLLWVAVCRLGVRRWKSLWITFAILAAGGAALAWLLNLALPKFALTAGAWDAMISPQGRILSILAALSLFWIAAAWLSGQVQRSWLESLLVMVGWAVPVGILLSYNWLAMGTLTGYDATNESTGFAWAFFYDNWETIIRQLNVNGLFLVMPLAVGGLIAMFWWNWRVAVFVWLWTLPCLTLYTFYYWAPDGVGYLRFVLTILPPMLVGGYWLITHLRDLMPAEPRRVPAYLMLLTLTLSGLAVAIAGYYGLRFDLATKQLASVHDYLQQPPSSFARLGGWASFVSAIVMLGALGAAVSASTFLRRAIVPTLAAGAVTLLSIAVQADDSTTQFERDNYDRALLQPTIDLVRQKVPDGAVLICREEGLDNYLQFATNDRIYTGLSFDRNWVKGRPAAATADPVLIDPVRGQQLIDALKDPAKPDDVLPQPALNDQARTLVQSALLAKRRVFVLEPVNVNELQRLREQKKPLPDPQFVRLYIANKPKDQSLVGKRVLWWDIPIPVKDDVKSPFRGRKDSKPNYRVAAFQLWEITGQA